MKIFSLFILSLLITSNSLSGADWNVYIAKYKQDKACAISYTFDDGLAEHYTLVAPQLEKRGFRGTFWICGSKINKDSETISDTTRMTWPQLREMSDNGHEISNHGWAHKNFARFPIEEIKEDILKERLKFFINTIYEPNIKNNQFDSKYFEIKKSDLELRIKNNLANVDFYNDYRLLQIVDPNGESTRIIENHQEQLKDLNPTTTYEFYKKIVLEKLPFIFVVGDVEKTKLESLFDELLFKNKPHNKIEKINYNFTDYLTKIKTNIIKEKGPYNQSCLSYVYKVKDMHFNDTPYLKIVNLLLSSTSSNLLMDSLRTEGKLVYYAGSYIYTHNGLLIIEARIGSKSYKEAKKRIEETFDKLKDQQIIKPLLTNVKKQLYLDLIRAQDNKYYFLNQLINCQTFKCSMNLNEEYEIIKNMTTKDIANFIKRLELDTIYYLEGEKDAA